MKSAASGSQTHGLLSERPTEGSPPRASGVAACGPVQTSSTSPVRPLTTTSTRRSLPYCERSSGVK